MLSLDSKWWCAIRSCEYELVEGTLFDYECTRCGHVVDARDLNAKEWRLTYKCGWRIEWYNKHDDETVALWWQDGAGLHSGWRFDVERDGTSERPHMQGTNGFTSYYDAFLLADWYMSTGSTVPAMGQEEWVDNKRADYEFRVAHPTDFTPGRPLSPTGRNR